MSDRIEAGSYACAVGIAGGEVDLLAAKADEMEATLDALRHAGLHIDIHGKGIRVASDGKLKPLTLSTAPYPGLATDMQAPELNRMGADIETKGRTAVVRGVQQLTGAPVMATDLRASMSLAIAGLAAEGETRLQRIYHLDRGYERFEEKLAAVGADIERISGD